MKKYIYIVGGCGFLGKVLADLLITNNFNIIIIDQPNKKKLCPINVKFVGLDICSKKSFEQLKITSNDIIINLASRQYQDKVPFFNKQNWFDEVNFYGAKNLFDHAMKAKVSKYIYFSTDMVYGISKNDLIDENSLKKPIGPYGKSKLKFENYLYKNRNEAISIVIFRSRLIIGSGRLGVFNTLFKLIKKSSLVPIIGNGLNSYQMVSVYDCSIAILNSIKKNNIDFDIFNLGSTKRITVNNLIKNLISYSNSNSKIINLSIIYMHLILYLFYFLGIRILCPEQFRIADKNINLDTSKALKILNWKPKNDDLSMIKESYDYWLKNIN